MCGNAGAMLSIRPIASRPKVPRLGLLSDSAGMLPLQGPMWTQAAAMPFVCDAGQRHNLLSPRRLMRRSKAQKKSGRSGCIESPL